MYKILAAFMLALAVTACTGGGGEHGATQESVEKAGEAMKEAGEAVGEAAEKAGEAAGHAADAAKEAAEGEH
jgi:methyl-accepting chemotaxis protein